MHAVGGTALDAARVERFRLDVVGQHLGELLGLPVHKLDEVTGPSVDHAVSIAGPGSVVLLENLRFDAREEKNDPAFAALVRRTFEQLAESRELSRLYDQWFQHKLPSGRTLGIAMSPQLESIFESLGQPTATE